LNPTVGSFAAIIDSATHSLVLGSMPGVASLHAAEYYAHPRNLFWPFLGLDPKLVYLTRLAALRARGIGLWDVLATCECIGS